MVRERGEGREGKKEVRGGEERDREGRGYEDGVVKGKGGREGNGRGGKEGVVKGKCRERDGRG